MNFILLSPTEVQNDRVQLTGARALFVRDQLNRESGGSVRAGVVSKGWAEFEVTKTSEKNIDLRQRGPFQSLPKKDIHLILALPRPKVLRRVIFQSFLMGVSNVTIFHCYRVEKSYWQSGYVSTERLEAVQQKAMQQCGDFQPMTLNFEKRFRPFVEDRLPGLIHGKRAVVYHPYSDSQKAGGEEQVVVIGPEGGFVSFELELLKSQGLKFTNLGDRILNVETAVAMAISRAVF